MKKSILVILLVLLAFTVWSVLVFGKAKQEEPTKQPTQIQKTELSPGPEEFPAVVLPKAKPTKPTVEDFQKLMLEKKGITREMLEQRKLENVPAEDFEALEKEPLTLCTIGNQILPCCYRSTPDNPYLRCWGAVSTATYMDPDNNGYGIAVCPYPIYPFNATKVMMAINTTDTCTVVFRPEIWSAAYIDHSPYPDEPIWIGPEYTFKLPGGTNSTYLNLAAPSPFCLYEPWFAVVTYMNTDDRLDPAYCPDGNAIPDYQSWIFDIAGRLEQSYWAPYAEYGYPYGFFDVVENGICSGAIRVRTQGYNRPENACPILPDDYYYKVGLPDFTQYYPGVPGPAYCGPVAGANSVWWFACIDSQFTPSWGGCNPGDEIALINEIAAAAGTNPILGTNCDSLEAAIIKVVKAHGGWNFIETTVYAPEFWYLQYQLRICEDVVLLLGFWQFDGANWTRFGGHFVTLAGVDYTNYAFAFSDPATPTVIDKYFVAWPSVSPGGIVWIPDYYLPWPDFQGQNAGPLPNTGPYNPQLPVVVEVEQAIVVSPGPLKMYGTVHSGVLPVWPDSIRAFEKEDNRGSIDDFGKDFNKDGLIFDALYGGSLIVGTTQENLNCDYGDFVPLRTFVPLGPPVCTSFVVIGSAGPYTIEQCTYKFAHSFIPGLIINKYAFGFWVPVGGTEECEQVIEDVFVLENTGTDPIICLEKAVWLDFDISAGGTSDQSYGSQPFQSKWMWNAGAPDSVYGLTKIPVGTKAITGWGLSQPDRVYDGQYLDSLKYWMENLGWGDDNDLIAMDRSILIADACFDLAPVGMPGSMHINKWLKWGFEGLLFPQADTTVYPAQYAKWRHFLYNILHQEGFYRGDVNQDEWLDVNDVVFLKKYLAGGQPPIEFIDQGDVNCDGNVDNADLVYLKAFLCKGGGGPAPIDKNRFLLNSPFVDPAHKALGTRNPGLFGDPDWADLSGGVEKFRCGDANGNDKVLVDDVIYLINYLFKGGPAPIDVSDVNLDGKVLVDDVIYLINWLFKGGPAPCGCP